MPVEQAVKRVTEDEKNKEIGKRVREAREEKGWSQNELAKRSSVNQANQADQTRPTRPTELLQSIVWKPAQS